MDDFYSSYQGSQSSMTEEFESFGRNKRLSERKNTMKNVISGQEAAKLEDELLNLKKVKRKEVAKKIKDARQKGNLFNNIAYENAKQEQREIETRIEQIQKILSTSMVDLELDNELTYVNIGSIVRIHDLEYDEYLKYTVVKTEDANSLQFKISDQSPLGMALIGKQVGEIITVSQNGNSMKFLIKGIDGIDPKYKNLVSNMINSKTDKHRQLIEIQPKDFLTRSNVYKCTNAKHSIIDIECKIKVLKPNGSQDYVTIPGACCRECNKYYILENEYQKLKQKNYILLCKIVEKEFWKSAGNGYNGLNQESLLHILGYNVNAQIDIPKAQRWRLLEIFVDEGIFSTMEICSHLQMLMRRNKNNKNFDKAIKKWNADYEHIASYGTSKRSTVSAKSITHTKYKR